MIIQKKGIATGGDRTHDLQIRSQTLFPLRGGEGGIVTACQNLSCDIPFGVVVPFVQNPPEPQQQKTHNRDSNLFCALNQVGKREFSVLIGPTSKLGHEKKWHIGAGGWGGELLLGA